MQQIIKTVAKCMNALNFDILEEAVALHSNMHDIGNKMVHYFATNGLILTFQPLSFM